MRVRKGETAMRQWAWMGIVLLAAGCRQAPLIRVPSTFVPAQTLHFEDAGGREAGTLALGTDGMLKLSWHVAPKAADVTVSLTRKGRLAAVLASEPAGHPSVLFDVNRKIGFGIIDAAGRYQSIPGRPRRMTASFGTARLITERLYHLVVPPAPDVTLDDVVPDQDRRLIDKDGQTFAVGGLSSAAEPSLGLLDRDGRLRVAMHLSGRRWLRLSLLDTSGEVRVALAFGPQRVPHATIWEHDDPDSPDRLSPYMLDLTAGREQASDGGGWLSWFEHDMFSATVPIRLVDQRGGVVWKE